MAKKKNVYSQVSLGGLKEEIDSIVEYLSTIDPESLTDEVDWKVTQKGTMPMIVAKIEEVLDNALINVKDCSLMLVNIVEIEGVSEYIINHLDTIKAKLNEIQEYYKKRPISAIEHRRLVYSVPGKATAKNPNPQTRSLSFLVATKYQQIAYRSRITKKIYEAVPILEKLQSLKDEADFKGDIQLPPSFLLLGMV